MIEFFRDVISGPVYIVTTILSVIFIMAIIGFLMERKKLEKEHNEQVAVVSNKQTIQPIKPVTVESEVLTNPTPVNVVPTVNNLETNSNLGVNEPAIIFNEPNQKEE